MLFFAVQISIRKSVSREKLKIKHGNGNPVRIYVIYSTVKSVYNLLKANHYY